MKIHHDEAQGIWYAISTYAEKDVLKTAGFRWSPQDKRWWTNRPEIALRLADAMEMGAALEAEERQEEIAQAVQASQAVTSTMDIPAPAGLTYLPYQRAGIEFMSTRKGVLLADEMGLGKTVQAIGCINLTCPGSRVLVVCPATLKRNWQVELNKWLIPPRVVTIIKSGDRIPVNGVVVINYDLLVKYEKELSGLWDIMILDEAHYAKNRKAARTKAVKRIAAHAVRIFCLTGTPVLNRPVDIFELISMLDSKTWSNWWSFTKRYCDAHNNGFGLDVSGASNTEELARRLRETVMLRRLKADVLADLPAKRRQVITLGNGKGDHKDMTALRDMVDTWGDDVEKLKSPMAAFAEIAKLRHATALSKVPQVIEHVTNVLEQEKKVVVFAHHKDVIAQLAEGLAEFGPVLLTGDTAQDARQGVVNKFQTDAGTRVFIGSITAAGVGVTLTAASVVVFAELDWTPSNLTQAEDRLHRIGQTDTVLVQHLVIDGSIDARLAKLVCAKQTIIDQIVDGRTPEDVGRVTMKELLD